MALQKAKKSAPMKVRKVVKPVAGQPEVAKAARPAKAGNHVYAVGRRKTASARVRLSRGGSGFVVNGKPANEYFKTVDPTGTLMAVPFKAVAKEGFSATVKVVGSGLHAQLDAVIHGISRALVTTDVENKPALRKAGLLTRDDRMRQSRNMGTGGKARRQKQSPKR